MHTEREKGQAPRACAVVMPVPDADRKRVGRARVVMLSRLARQALAESARRLGVLLGPLAKDDNGAPLPAGGWYWSLTHKPTWVGAVLAPVPVGIDLERVKPVSGALISKIAADKEWHLGDDPPDLRFFRFWTSKEAVLKAVRVGFKGLPACRIVAVSDHLNLLVRYGDRIWPVEQIYFDGHIAAVAADVAALHWVRFASHGTV